MKTQKSVARRIKRKKGGLLLRGQRIMGAKAKARSKYRRRKRKPVELSKTQRKAVRRLGI